MRRALFLVPVLVFLLLLGYFALPLLRHSDPSLVASPLIDKPAPDFALPPLPGETQGVARANLIGQVQLVNVFASWCVPCRAEAPALMALARDHKIVIWGIAQKDKPEDTAAFLAELGNPYRAVGVDRDGRASIDWGVYGVPETYLVDAQGKIRLKHVGPLTPDDVEHEILPALKQLEASS